MPTIYERRDYAVRLAKDGRDAVLTIESPDGEKRETRLPHSLIDGASALPKELSEAVAASLAGSESSRGWYELPRIRVEVGVRTWAAMPWENLAVAGRIVVRSSPVRPRVLQIPITFPIRVLEADGQPVVPAAIEATFRGTARGDAYIEAHTTLADAEDLARGASWATVDVLHVHDLAPSAALLTNSRDAPIGTAGWLLRFAERFQTRLIVLDGYPSVPPVHRQLAQTIIDRGGPAVLLLGDQPSASELLYAGISHDRPLDWVHEGIDDSELFAGSGREEALRYSAVARELAKPEVAARLKNAFTRDFASPRKMRAWGNVDLAAISSAIEASATEMGVIDATGVRFNDLWGTRAQRFGHSLAARLPEHGLVAVELGTTFENLRSSTTVLSVEDLATHVVAASRPFHSINRAGAADLFSMKVDDIIHSSPTYEYEHYESDGMLPLAAKIADARSLANAVRVPKASPSRRPRHVNSAFYATRPDGKLERIAQANARLRLEEVIHLGVQIGPTDELIVSLGSTRFLDEEVRWGATGAWMEIGVTGIDFEVVGDPVQEFFLSREQTSDLVAFAVRPKKTAPIPGIARLRFTIFHRSNVVQSFLVAAALQDAPHDVASSIACALGVPSSDEGKIGTAGYVARLEYGTIANIADAARVGQRGLTIIANDSAGDKITTFKGDDLFRVSDDDHSTVVAGARRTLTAASLRGEAYRYQDQGRKNTGDRSDLTEVLPDIAYAGWKIYNALVPEPGDQERIRGLIEKGDGIHAAHLDFSNVIPWSMIYDREVFFDRNHAPPSVCQASMPDGNGVLPNVACGGVGCLLNESSNADRVRAGQPAYVEAAVVCPRRFWGFMFPIDVPAHKLDEIGERSTGLIEEIKANDPLTVVAGFNENLTFGATHVAELRQGVLKDARMESCSGRVPVRTLIKTHDPDIVYFYCHALAKSPGKDAVEFGAALDFGHGTGDENDILVPADFGGRPVWTHGPLVFLNGCSTVGFNPYAPSEFIKQFVRAKRAAAVIGTETTIIEMLATEVAEFFLADLLAGLPAGDALLRTRRRLLSKNNPLGLMYTLYGSARLKLVRAAVTK
jgi:hypothetical protein